LSTEKLLGAALPPTTCLAAAGVQLVANLLDTLSIVELWLDVALGLYQDGKISVVGDGSTEPIPTCERTTNPGWCCYTGWFCPVDRRGVKTVQRAVINL
jgi:hypothetical protein